MTLQLDLEKMKDRFKLNKFVSLNNNEPEYLRVQEIEPEVYSTTKLFISTLAMDFPKGTSIEHRKELEAKWIDLLPKLDLVNSISIRHRVNQDFFESVCKMKNLKHLHFWSSTVEDISSIVKLVNLEYLEMESFSRLTDISPLLNLKNNQILSIENSFKIENYDSIGEMTQLVGLRLKGDSNSPKNLRLKSLKPFSNLKNLRHLDLSITSVIDKSFETILELENLERFDITGNIPKQTRELIKNNHKNLKAGFFVDYDYNNNRFYEGKLW